MGKGRLEAFSDGVIAIIITIMVLEMKVPHGEYLESIAPLWPVFVSYVLSFVIVAIYWNNHHHMLHSVKHVTGAVLWSNAHLLFWLSLMPFTTGWMGENHFAPRPVSLYGVNLLMCAVAYFILVHALIATHGRDSEFAARIGIGLERQDSAAWPIPPASAWPSSACGSRWCFTPALRPCGSFPIGASRADRE